MKSIKTKWQAYNFYILKKYPLVWLAGCHILLLLLPLLFVLYTWYFLQQHTYYSVFVKSIPLYLNIVIMMVLLFYCFVRRKLLVNWKQFARYVLLLIANGIMLSVVLALASLFLLKDPLHIKQRIGSKAYPQDRLENFRTNLQNADLWGVEQGSALLYYTDIVQGSALDSVTSKVPPIVEGQYQVLCKLLEVPENFYLTQTDPYNQDPAYTYEKTYRDLLNYGFEEKARTYMLGLNLTGVHFFWTSLFVLGNMICFFLAVQVIDKKETTKNIVFFIAMIIGTVLIIASLDSMNSDLKDPTTIGAIFGMSMVINYRFHRGRRFVEGIQKLLVFLHSFMWILVIVYSVNRNSESFVLVGELLLFIVSMSITFFVFKRFFQPQKITG